MTTNINIKIPNNPMTMLAQGDNEFTIIASIIARPTGTPSNGQPIVWQILNNVDNHGSSFIRGLEGRPSSALRHLFPPVKNVLSFINGVDDSYARNGVFCGSSVGISSADMFAYRRINGGMTLRGNGIGWNISTSPNGLQILNINSVISGRTAFDIPPTSTNLTVNNIGISYVGTNNYRIERLFSGIPGSAGFAFFMVDIATNTRVTTAPTTADAVVLTGINSPTTVLNLNTWGNPATIETQQHTNIFMSAANFNFWCIGLFELWMKAAPVSDTEIKVKWQAKSGVTEYRLNRSTGFTVDVNGNYVLTAPTQVYAGTDLSFVDTGLTTDTMYYYQLTDQTNTEITQFNTKTL